MKKQKEVVTPAREKAGTTISHCNFTNNHPPLPDGHIEAVRQIAIACEQTARALVYASEALRGPANNSVGLRIEG